MGKPYINITEVGVYVNLLGEEAADVAYTEEKYDKGWTVLTDFDGDGDAIGVEVMNDDNMMESINSRAFVGLTIMNSYEWHNISSYPLQVKLNPDGSVSVRRKPE